MAKNNPTYDVTHEKKEIQIQQNFSSQTRGLVQSFEVLDSSVEQPPGELRSGAKSAFSA